MMDDFSVAGRPIDGVWHTGVGVYGREYLFGSSGVSYTAPEEIFRQGLAPKPRVSVEKMEESFELIGLSFCFRLDLGQTKKSLSEIQTWIMEKSSNSFR